MAWSQTDRDALADRIKAGVLTVEYEGRRVTYQNMTEMRRLLAEMDAEIASASGTAATRSYCTFTRD